MLSFGVPLLESEFPSYPTTRINIYIYIYISTYIYIYIHTYMREEDSWTRETTEPERKAPEPELCEEGSSQVKPEPLSPLSFRARILARHHSLGWLTAHSPHGGVRPFHPKSTCFSLQCTSGHHAMQIWTRGGQVTLGIEGNEPLVLHRVAHPSTL